VASAVFLRRGFRLRADYFANLMVMGPGGYACGDYLWMGVPLAVLSGVLTVLIAPWPF